MNLPVIHISRMGNLGNQMFQLMAARSLARRVPNSIVSSEPILPWGLDFPFITAEGRRSRTITTHRIPMDELAAELCAGRIDHVDLQSYAQHMDNFSDGAASYSKDFPLIHGETGGSDDELVINVRAGEILSAPHPDYVLVPIDFLQAIVSLTRLRPVFCGQTEMNNPYLYSLRAAFPEAKFLANPGPMRTFEYMRHSRHIMPSISTFAWLAAWFSTAQTIILPLLGFYNPFQARTQNLVPLSDPRYKFYLFPASYAVPASRFKAAHVTLNGQWRFYEHDTLSDYIASMPRVAVRPHNFFKFFDETFYRDTYPDVTQSIEIGAIPNGRHHYENYGVHEGRDPFDLDKAFYVQTYPQAALEIGQGDYTSPYHHFVEAGFARGYKTKDAAGN